MFLYYEFKLVKKEMLGRVAFVLLLRFAYQKPNSKSVGFD